VVADREFHELPAYREVLRPLGAEQLLATSFRLPDGRSACLVLNRARTDFSDRDVLRINALSARMSSLARFSSTLRPARPLSSVGRTLTPSEQRVLACVADGLTDRAAARRLGVAEATVRKHLEHSYRKLGVTNRVAATMSWLTGEGEPAQRAVANRLARAARHPQRVTEAGRGPSTHPGPALDPSPG
jgi:DNA-binding CsgD family transcriptional regulator